MSKAVPRHKDKLMHGRHVGNEHQHFLLLFFFFCSSCVWCVSGAKRKTRTNYVRRIAVWTPHAVLHLRANSSAQGLRRTHTHAPVVGRCATADVILDKLIRKWDRKFEKIPNWSDRLASGRKYEQNAPESVHFHSSGRIRMFNVDVCSTWTCNIGLASVLVFKLPEKWMKPWIRNSLWSPLRFGMKVGRRWHCPNLHADVQKLTGSEMAMHWKCISTVLSSSSVCCVIGANGLHGCLHHKRLTSSVQQFGRDLTHTNTSSCGDRRNWSDRLVLPKIPTQCTATESVHFH